MALLDNDTEKLRKQRLKTLEDKRLAFAEKLSREGFKPEKMLFCSTEVGSFVALARMDKKYVVVTSPAFNDEEGEFAIHYLDEIHYRKEDQFIKSEGMGGIFGFGKKGAVGYAIVITMPDETEVRMDFMAGRNSYMDVDLKKNPLLNLKRRRGDANLLWDMLPIERGHLDKIERKLAEYYLA